MSSRQYAVCLAKHSFWLGRISFPRLSFRTSPASVQRREKQSVRAPEKGTSPLMENSRSISIPRLSFSVVRYSSRILYRPACGTFTFQLRTDSSEVRTPSGQLSPPFPSNAERSTATASVTAGSCECAAI